MDNREERDDFGLDISNPIQVSSIPEARNYLDRIVTDSGEEIRYQRLGSELSTNIKTVSEGLESLGTMVDCYEISNPKREHLAWFYICPYFERNSSVAPRGFKYRTSSSIHEELLVNIDSNTDELEPMSDEDVDEERLRQIVLDKAEEMGVDLPPDFDVEEIFQSIIDNPATPEELKSFREGSHTLQENRRNGNNTGCFIATATLGDYDHPIVLELRRFRDEWILRRIWGKQFVELYYYYGSITSKYIASSLILRKLSFYFIVKPVYFIARILLIKSNS